MRSGQAKKNHLTCGFELSHTSHELSHEKKVCSKSTYASKLAFISVKEVKLIHIAKHFDNFLKNLLSMTLILILF